MADVTPDQLAFEELANAVDQSRPMNKDEALLAKEIESGPQKLVAELVKRGMDREHLVTAAALALVLDEPREDG